MPLSSKAARKVLKPSSHSRRARSRTAGDLTPYGYRLLHRLRTGAKCRPRFLVPFEPFDDCDWELPETWAKPKGSRPQHDRFVLFDKDILNRGPFRLFSAVDSVRSVYVPVRLTNEYLAAATAGLDMQTLPCTKPSLKRFRLPMEQSPFWAKVLSKEEIHTMK